MQDMKENDSIEFCDYPYLGIGEKPTHGKSLLTDEQLEKIIGG